MKFLIVRLLALVGLAAGLAPAAAQAGDWERFPGVPYVAARGAVEIERVPDRAVLKVEVAERGKDNAGVLPVLAAKAEKLLAAVRGAGIADTRIKAPGPTARDIFDIVRDDRGREIVEKRTKIGIEANYALTIEVGGVDTPDGRQTLEKTIAAIAGTDSALRSIVFSVADERELVARLEREATKAAVAKARGLIEAAGARPGRVLAITDSYHAAHGGENADLARPSEAAQINFVILPGTQRFIGSVEVILESLP